MTWRGGQHEEAASHSQGPEQNDQSAGEDESETGHIRLRIKVVWYVVLGTPCKRKKASSRSPPAGSTICPPSYNYNKQAAIHIAVGPA